MDTARYKIRVERTLGPGLAAHFPEFTLTNEGGSTLMCGCLPDQASLHGVLARIRDLGLTLISVEMLPDADAPAECPEDQNL